MSNMLFNVKRYRLMLPQKILALLPKSEMTTVVSLWNWRFEAHSSYRRDYSCRIRPVLRLKHASLKSILRNCRCRPVINDFLSPLVVLLLLVIIWWPHLRSIAKHARWPVQGITLILISERRPANSMRHPKTLPLVIGLSTVFHLRI